MGRWALTGLVINSTIGVGIFKLPADVARLVGDAAPWSYLVAAVFVGMLVAVIAELGSQFTQAGGQYLYARTAFGPLAGIQTGWFVWLTRLAATSAIINVLVAYLGEWWPGIGRFERGAVIVGLAGMLAVVNFRGIRTGVGFSNAITIAKLAMLALFIAAGLILLPGAVPASVPVPHSAAGWGDALVVLVYAFGGFENAMIPAAETKNPRRDAPFALFAALAVVTVCYLLAHIVCMRGVPDLSTSKLPFADAARAFAGTPGAKAIAIGVMLSAFGTVSAAFVTAPRLTYALAERGDFPAFFAAVHPRHRTPHVSILIWTVLVCALSLGGGFLWNAILSVAARLITYGMTCASLIQMRRRFPDADAWRAPFGILAATVGLVFCGVLASRFETSHVLIISGVAAAGLLNWMVVRSKSNPRHDV